jgi:hypothetical protein
LSNRHPHKDSVEQHSVCPKACPNLRPIAPLLPGMVGAPSCSLSGKRDMTETHAAMPINARISPFQVHRIHLDISLQYYPGPWVPAPSSAIYRSRNSAPERQFSTGFFSMETGSNRAKETALSSIWCALTHIPTSARSRPSFLERPVLQVGDYCGNRGITELHPATPHIDGISPFQVYYRIY